MGLASGLQSQLGFINETTVGTFATPTKFVEFTSEDLRLEIDRIESKGLRAGRTTLHRWAAGVQRVVGGFEMELVPQGAALLWKHALGACVTAGAGPYTHTCTPTSALDALGLTIQVNKPDISGTNRVFSYLGCQITDWEISAAVNEYAMAKFGIFGMAEDTGQSLASASFPATYTPFTFAHGTVTVAGSAHDVKSFTLSGDNGLATNRHRIRATTPTYPKISLSESLRSFTGTLVTDFVDLTDYGRFTGATETALVLTFNAGASAIMTITMNVRYDGDTPTVGGAELLEQSLPFKAVHATADSSAITVVVTNGDSAP